MKHSTIIIAILILAACSGGRTTPPQNLDNACSIVKEKKSWSRNLQSVERKYGVPAEVILATIYYESRFVAKARTPRKYTLGVIPMGRQSSAYGYAQALDGTWDWYLRATGLRGGKRDRFDDAVDFMGWYMTVSNTKNGISKSDAYNQYLAYHQGHTGFSNGSYRNKAWLLGVARNVQERADRYGRQLATCWR
jgi:hypothetical protein